VATHAATRVKLNSAAAMRSALCAPRPGSRSSSPRRCFAAHARERPAKAAERVQEKSPSVHGVLTVVCVCLSAFGAPCCVTRTRPSAAGLARTIECRELGAISPSRDWTEVLP